MRTGTWAKTALITPENKVLLLRRSKTDSQRPGDWDFPGGNIEPGEDITAGLLREVDEEVGIQLEFSDVRLVYAATQRHTTVSATRLLYVATVSEQAVTLSFEHDEYKWVDFDTVFAEFQHSFYSVGLKYARDNGLLA